MSGLKAAFESFFRGLRLKGFSSPASYSSSPDFILHAVNLLTVNFQTGHIEVACYAI
jgi:hypothetical protein